MVEGPQRRLAAIVSADVVGYSRLMGVDETGTLPRSTPWTVASGVGGFPLNESNQRQQGTDHEYGGAQVNWPKMNHPIVLKDTHVMHRQSHHQADNR